MPKQIIIAEQHRIAAVFSEDQIHELIVSKGSHQVSDIYLGVVENVLPGIDAAFVNIGDAERNGFIHVTDLGPLRLKRISGAITELLAPQQKVLVQVMKEPTGTKGPRLTGNITLPGRYLVLMPFGRGVNLSRRIKSETERNRLRALAILIKPAGMGLLVRTEAEGMTEETVMEDLEVLQKQWEAIQREASSTRAPALLNRDDDFIQRVLRDMYSADVNRIVVDSHNGLKRVKQHLLNWSAGKATQGVLVDHHRDRIPVLEYFRVNAAIREALKPRVDLPSGGYIIIEPTEALTVIDVNSGSFTRSATARETVLWTNCEAATEIARQLCLRNIAGVIIVDFIDMDKRQDQLQVLEHFNKALKTDKARPQIAQLSELGLVELTRKRQGKNIYELFGRVCPNCGGLGHLVRLPGEADLEEEEIERPGTVVVQREYRTPEISSREGYEPEIGSESQDLDLTNHPSYQELRGEGRRHRRRIGEAPLRDDELRPSEPRLPAAYLTPNHTTGPILSPDPLERSNIPLYGNSEVFPRTIVKDSRQIIDRSKPAKREIPKPISERPEVVSVEMSPLEQDVYAWMGVSPLVRVEREIKNPKSAIVSVRLPGEPDTTPEPDFRKPQIPEPSDRESVPVFEESDAESDEPEQFEPTPPVLEEVSNQETYGSSSSEDYSSLSLTENSESGETDSGIATRRRRRRSSALFEG